MNIHNFANLVAAAFFSFEVDDAIERISIAARAQQVYVKNMDALKCIETER